MADMTGGQSRTAFEPTWASPPGDTLAAILEERGMTQTELAERLGVSLKHVNRVVKGAASLSPEMALGLEKVLGASASFWMTREAHYQADRARQAERIELGDALEWAKRFPLSDLRGRPFFPRYAKGSELVEALLRFFGIAHPSQWRDPSVAYRKSRVFQSDPYALSTWLREGELAGAAVDCALYDEDRFVQVLQQVRPLTRLEPEEWWPRLQLECAAAGVAVVVIDTYTGAKVNGATRWLSADKALIQLSLRYRWEDVFWFTFFHEAGHVILHRKKDLFVETRTRDPGLDPGEKAFEAEADRFAARTLIPPPNDRRLRNIETSEIETFADLLGIAPAIVVGRLQHDRLLAFNRGNDLRRRLGFAPAS